VSHNDLLIILGLTTARENFMGRTPTHGNRLKKKIEFTLEELDLTGRLILFDNQEIDFKFFSVL
jgi:hypothetical protein